MPDETTQPDARGPVTPAVNVNVGNGRPAMPDLSGGLVGNWRTVMNVTAVTFVMGLLAAVTIWNRYDWRQDRAEDRSDRAEERTQWKIERAEERSLFRDALREMNVEQNRRTGEVKGSTDRLIDVVRENNGLIQRWIEESRKARAEHVPPPKSGELKPTMP